MEDNRKRKYVDIKINKQTVWCLLDTGSDISSQPGKNRLTKTTEHG